MDFMESEYRDNKRRQLEDKKSRIALFGQQRESNKLALNKLTNQERMDTIDAFKGFSATQRQRVTAQGLSNTSIASVLERGVKRDESAALNRLRDNAALRRIGVESADTERLASAFYTPTFDTSGVGGAYSALLQTPFAPSTTGTVGLYGNAILQGLIRVGLAYFGGPAGAAAGALIQTPQPGAPGAPQPGAPR